eukprot:2102520-Amphidinium_carterae.2
MDSKDELAALRTRIEVLERLCLHSQPAFDSPAVRLKKRRRQASRTQSDDNTVCCLQLSVVNFRRLVKSRQASESSFQFKPIGLSTMSY